MRGETGFRPEVNFAEQFNPEAAIEQLHPEIIETEEGLQHTVYTFGADKPVRVMFCNPEELPFSDSLAEQHRLFLFGDQPKRRQTVDWETFVKKMRQNSNPVDEPINPRVLDTSTSDTLFMVQTNPRALLDMALVLGVPSDTKKEITEARRLSEQRQATAKSDWVVDASIAAKLVGPDEKAHIPAVRSTDAEALVLLALTGDKEAEKYLNTKIQCLQNIDEAKKSAHWQEERSAWEAKKLELGRDVEPLKLKELVGVHMTQYLPARSGDSWAMSTTFDATKGKVPRATQHFTLNHPVRSAGSYGNWESMPICMIDPLENMIAQNGKPAALNTVDTFWQLSPGHTMNFSQDSAWLIKPGLVLEPGTLAIENGHEVIYKTSRISPEDINELCRDMGTRDRLEINSALMKNSFTSLKQLQDSQSGYHKYKLIIDQEDYRRLLVACGWSEENTDTDYIYFGELTKDLLGELMNHPIAQVVESLCKQAQVSPETTNKVQSEFQKKIENFFASMIKYHVIENKIRDLGYIVHQGGMWAWDADSWEATTQTQALGKQLEVPVLPHSVHISFTMEEVCARRGGQLTDGTLSPKQYCKQPVSKDILEFSPAFRRLLYELGKI